MDQDELDRGLVTNRIELKDLIPSKERKSEFATIFQPDSQVKVSLPGKSKVKHDPILNKALMKAVSVDNEMDAETALLCGANVDAQGPPFFISALQFAAWLGSKKMVEFLLSNGASSNSSDIYGRTPLHMAAAMGFKDCVYLLLEGGANPNSCTKEIDPSELVPIGLANSLVASAKTLKRKGYDFDPYLDGFQMPVLDCGRRTPLHEAVKANSPESVSFILKMGGVPDVPDCRGMLPLLLAGSGITPQDLEAVSRYEQVVSDLLENGASANACHPGTGTSALHNAITLWSTGSTMMLLRKKANPAWSSSAGSNITAIHEAAGMAKTELLELLLLSEKDPNKRRVYANIEDAIGRTPLHRAANVGSRSCVSLLIAHGANLGLRTKIGVSALEALFHHVRRPKQFMFEILDSKISSNAASAEERCYMLFLDFEMLVPGGSKRQTEVLNSIITAKGVSKDNVRALLGHPLIEAFVRLKWHRLRRFFFAVVLVYTMFVFTLSLYVTLEFLYPPDTEYRTANICSFLAAIRYIHLLFAFIVLMNVIGQCIAYFRYYSRQFETWTNGMSAILSILWILALEYSNLSMHHRDYDKLIKHFISIAVPLSWVGLMLLLGRFPLWGSHALLFTAVLKNVLWTFVVLGCIVLGFSFSFFVQFHSTHKAAFGNPWRAFIKTMVMMTGEYEYTTIFSEDNDEDVLQGTSRVTFLLFVVVASIVLVNLIVGLAVSDTQALKEEGQSRCLYKRAEFVDLLESMVAPLARRQTLPSKVVLQPNIDAKENRSELSLYLPSRVLESLVDIALMSKDESLPNQKNTHNSWTLEGLSGGNNMEAHIFNMLQAFLRDITQTLAPEGVDIQRRLMERSPRMSRLGNQVVNAHRAMTNYNRQKNTTTLTISKVEKPNLRIQC